MDSFYPNVDGVVLVIDNLARSLSKNNDVTLVVPYTSTFKDDKKYPYEIKRIRSYKIPFSEYRFTEYKNKFSRAYKYLIEKDFDIIHIHSPFLVGQLGLRISRKLHIPCVCTMHTRYDFEIRKRLDSDIAVKAIMDSIIKVYNDCDAGIAINHKMIDVYKDYGYKHEPTVIYNGTDLLPLEKKDIHLDVVNKMFNLKSDDVVFLFVGRIIEIKNIFFILDALKLLKEDHIKFKMIYVGDGPDLSKLKHKIKEYNMEEYVILAGKIMDRNLLSNIYLRSTLFLFPSLFDASSLVQIEASVNETPGLFIEGSVTADTVTNNINGFTSKNDVVSYKERIKEILGNKKLLSKVSKNARSMLGRNWDDISLLTLEFYNEQIEKYKKSVDK